MCKSMRLATAAQPAQVPLGNTEIGSYVFQRHVSDNAWICLRKLRVTCFGGQVRHIVDPLFILLQMLLQNADRVILLGGTGCCRSLGVIATDP